MLRKIGIGVLVAIVVALGVTGLVMAQEPTPPTDGFVPGGGPWTGGRFGMPGGRGGPGGPHFEVLAEALGLAVEELQEALSDGQTVAEIAEAQGVDLDDVVDALVAAAREQADERIAQLEESLPEALESGSFGLGRRMGRGGFRGPGGGAHAEVLAETLGLTVEELVEAVSGGQSIAEVAEAQGVDLDTIVDALVAAQSERLQQAVEDGRITQEQADEHIAQMEEHIRQMLESGAGMFGNPPCRPGGMRGRFQGGGAMPRFPGRAGPSNDL
jgi:uncharacterized protein (DUF433 family)